MLQMAWLLYVRNCENVGWKYSIRNCLQLYKGIVNLRLRNMKMEQYTEFLEILGKRKQRTSSSIFPRIIPIFFCFRLHYQMASPYAFLH